MSRARDEPPSLVISGWGAVTPAALGAAAHRDLFAGPDATSTLEVDRTAGYHRPRGAMRAARVDSKLLGDWVSARAARRMSPPSRYAVAAARMALVDAGLELGGSSGTERNPTAIVTATAYGPSSFTEQLLRQIDADPTTASPFLFTEAVANAPAAQIALAVRAIGPNVTLTQRGAGALQALATAARTIQTGRAERALVVAADEMEPLLHAALDRFGALADEGRPLDRDRRGFLLSEGATGLLLEPEAAATARGTKALWRLRAQWSGFDPTAPAWGWSRDPAPLARSLRRGLARAGLSCDSIQAVVLAAAGTRDGDRQEVAVLRTVWNAASCELPPVIAPKAWLGEFVGATLAGALAAAGDPGSQDLAGGENDSGPIFAGSPGFGTVDPGIGISPSPLAHPPRRLLVQTLSPGGSAAWCVLDAPSEGAGTETAKP